MCGIRRRGTRFTRSALIAGRQKQRLAGASPMSYPVSRARSHELAAEQIRKEFHDFDGGLRLQLGAQVGALADDVWAGLLCNRDDRVFDGALRYCALWVGGI